MEQHEDRPTVDAMVDPHDLDASTPDALIGATLHDTYKVVRVLAEGGMGRVYEATHTRIATKRFAIKVLLAELKHSLDVRLRFRREAEAAASVEHPNVVGVHDFGYAPDGRPYLVCDYLEGRELGTMLETRVPLSVSLSAAIARQLCSALSVAHDKGVIHRDIKPANVFLVGAIEDAPQVKILDFGLSKIVELTEAGVTQTGVIMGTPSYMAPEQARGERADHRVDIYGVGAVLYACLTGRPPHQEESAQQTILAVMTREAPRPCSLVPGIPPGLEIVVQRAMANQPTDRYASMRDLDVALSPYVSDTGPLSTRVSAPALPSVALQQASVPDLAEAGSVRNRAAGWLFLAALFSLLTASSAALGVLAILAPGRQVMQSELLLVALAVVGSVFTPAILVTRFIRRKYWNNSARMVDLVALVRSPVLAAAFAYGTASLLFRVLDASSMQLAMPIGAPRGSGWLGWAPFLAGVGLVAALAASLRQRLLAGSFSFTRRLLAGPVVVSLALLGSAATLYFGLDVGARARSEREAVAVPEVDDPIVDPAASGASIAGPPKPSPSLPTSSAVPTPKGPTLAPEDRAPPDALATAVAEGTGALGLLQTRYPRDPAVLEAYALALGKDPQRTSEMVRVLDALFAADPERAYNDKLSKLALSAALTPSTSQRAIDLMSGRMEVRGAEMLFDLVLSQPEIRPRARAALETSQVQRVLTPALKISFDIYTASTCEARVKLLPQAIRDGDERTVGALTIFTLSMKRPCGFKNRQQCAAPPLCAANVADFNNAKAAIKARLAEAAKK